MFTSQPAVFSVGNAGLSIKIKITNYAFFCIAFGFCVPPDTLSVVKSSAEADSSRNERTKKHKNSLLIKCH